MREFNVHCREFAHRYTDTDFAVGEHRARRYVPDGYADVATTHTLVSRTRAHGHMDVTYRAIIYRRGEEMVGTLSYTESHLGRKTSVLRRE